MNSGGTQCPAAGDQSEAGTSRALGDGQTRQGLQPRLMLCSFPLLEEELHNPYILERLLGLHALVCGEHLACYLTPASWSVTVSCCERRGDSSSRGCGQAEQG